jgi:hypothetical protein
MHNGIVKKVVLLSASLFAASLVAGCTVGKAPTEPSGNTVQNGSLVWYVSASAGSTYGDGTSYATAFNTLQAAAAVALPGDTVEVDSGTYTNNGAPVLDITTPGSATGGYITWEPMPNAKPVIQVGSFAYGAVQFESTAAYTIFKGFTVLGPNKSLSLAEAQACEGAAGVQSQCIVNNASCITINGNSSTTQQTGAVEPNHIQILNNTVGYCAGGGIGALSGDYITLSGNTIYDSAWYTIYGASAISMLGSYDTNPSDTTTKYKMQITNNTIYGNEEFIPWIAQGIITDGEGIILDSNLNSAYVGAGLNYPPYSGRFLVANNVIYNEGSAAVEVFESAHADIINNSTFNCNLNQDSEAGRGTLSISGGSNDVNAFNNIFYSNFYKYSNPQALAAPLGVFSGVSNIHIDYNIYYGSAANQWNGLGANGPHDMVVNPMYTSTPAPTTLNGTNQPLPTDLLNAPLANLQLLSGSPAIGAGTATFNGVTAPTMDILGNPRPSSAHGVSIGAYAP